MDTRFVDMATQTDGKTHIDTSSNTEGDKYLLSVKGKSGMNLAGLIEGTPLEWTYDTGAINTFITEDMYYNILPEQRPVLERVYKKFETANGSDLPITGTANMLLTFGQTTFRFRVFVGEVKNCLRRGCNFITNYQRQWNYEEKV